MLNSKKLKNAVFLCLALCFMTTAYGSVGRTTSEDIANKIAIPEKVIAPLKKINASNIDGIYTLGVYGDSIYTASAKIGYAAYFNDKENLAFSVDTLVSHASAKLLVTAATRFANMHRFKLTYEYLTETKDVDFYTGQVHENLYQNSIGAAYGVFFDIPLLKSLEVSSAYTLSNGQELSAKTIEHSELIHVEEKRNIAGATVVDAGAKLGFSLWPNSTIKYGVYYRDVSFKQINTPKTSYSNLGYSVDAAQVFANKVKITSATAIDRMDHKYQMGVGYFLPTTYGYAAEILATGAFEDNKYIDRKSYLAGVRTNIMFGLGKDAGYASTKAHNKSSLLEWTTKPVVDYSSVFAVSDSRITLDKTPGYPAYPWLGSEALNKVSPIYVYQLSKNPDNGRYDANGWKTNDGRSDSDFEATSDTTMYVTYNMTTGIAAAIYETETELQKLVLEKHLVTGVVGDSWHTYKVSKTNLWCEPHSSKDCWVIVE